MLKRVVRGGTLASALRGKAFKVSHLSEMLVVGLSSMAFIILGYFSSMPNLLSGYCEKMLNFIKWFFCID